MMCSHSNEAEQRLPGAPLNTSRLKIPTAYQGGFERAAAHNPGLATTYIQHTTIDDPLANDVVDVLARIDAKDINPLMNACLNLGTPPDSAAPPALRNFVDSLSSVPEWYDRDATLAGRLAFHKYLDLFIIGFIVVSLRNFNSLMSRVFFLTGEGTTRQGLRVIRQNIRYLTKTLMLPQALNPGEEGWKFSLRIRLAHARIRRNLRQASRWNETVYGTPISSAQMGLASANFSASLIRYVERLGARLTDDERRGLMQIWRYASWLVGTPDDLLHAGDEAQTVEFATIGHLCEPPPDKISKVIVNATVTALPELAKLKDPVAKEALVDHSYHVARALLGDTLADQFAFPGHTDRGVLFRMRVKSRFRRALRGTALDRAWFDDPFVSLLDAANLTDHLHSVPEDLRVPP